MASSAVRGHPADVVADHRLQEALGVEHHRLGCWRHRAEIGALRGEVEQRQPQLHRTLAVGDGVVQFLDHHRPAAGQTLQHASPATAADPCRSRPCYCRRASSSTSAPRRPLGHAEAAHVEATGRSWGRRPRAGSADRSGPPPPWSAAPAPAGWPARSGRRAVPVRALVQHQHARGWSSASPDRRWPSARWRSPSRDRRWPRRWPVSAQGAGCLAAFLVTRLRGLSSRLVLLAGASSRAPSSPRPSSRPPSSPAAFLAAPGLLGRCRVRSAFLTGAFWPGPDPTGRRLLGAGRHGSSLWTGSPYAIPGSGSGALDHHQSRGLVPGTSVSPRYIGQSQAWTSD